MAGHLLTPRSEKAVGQSFTCALTGLPPGKPAPYPPVSPTHPTLEETMDKQGKPLGTVEDLATRLNAPRHRGYQLAREGKVPGVVRIGRQIRIDMDAVEEWISAGGDLAGHGESAGGA
ncbi:MAG: DNA-binding protein [Gemmatimonadales bacterium]|nr:MAG: DNA-binding protein [Gemmatimonadales bacterium]